MSAANGVRCMVSSFFVPGVPAGKNKKRGPKKAFGMGKPCSLTPAHSWMEWGGEVLPSAARVYLLRAGLRAHA